MCTRRLHTGASSLFLPFSFPLTRAPSPYRFPSFFLSLSLVTSSRFVSLLFSRSARFSSFSFSSPLCSFFSMFDHQRHVRRTNACNIPGSGAKWKDILFVSLSFPSRGASSLSRMLACSRIVLDVSSVIGERFVDRSTMIAGREEQDDDVEHDRSVVAPLDLRCANASAHKRGNSGLRPSWRIRATRVDASVSGARHSGSPISRRS